MRAGQRIRAKTDDWKRRLYLPAYRYGEAAQLALTTAQTIARWYHGYEAPGHRMRPVLPARQGGLLSYLQLVEVVFVADFRRLGVRLDSLRRAHDYLRKAFQVEYPFAQLQIRTDGVSLLAEYLTYENGRALRRLLAAERGGQLVWPEAIERRFEQFDYERGLAVRWHPRGRQIPILIDPRIAFGAPIVDQTGIATWIIRERYAAGEAPDEIADDFGITQQQIAAALTFEGVELEAA